MKQKVFFRILVPATLVIILVFFIGTIGKESGRVPYKKRYLQLSTDCSQSWDIWSRLTKTELNEECDKELYLQVVNLSEIGFKPDDCQLTKVEIVGCSSESNHQLSCTYFCKRRVE